MPDVYKERTESNRQAPAPPFGYHSTVHMEKMQSGFEGNVTFATTTALPQSWRLRALCILYQATESEVSLSLGGSFPVQGEQQAGGKSMVPQRGNMQS